MPGIFFLFVLICGSGMGASAQSPLIESFNVSFFYGHRDLQIKALPEVQNLNFINYMNFLDYEPIGAPFIGLSTKFQLRNGLRVDLRLFSNDDIYPSGGKFSIQHFWNDFLGLGIGMFAYPFIINDYEEFHNVRDLQFHPMQSSLFPRNLYDLGWKVSPIIKYEAGRFFANLHLHLGFSGFFPFAAEFNQQMINSNFRRIIRYETDYDLQLFFLPALRTGVELFTLGNMALGIQLQTNYLVSRRSLNYTRITYNWTYENPVIEAVSNPKNRFNIWNVDFGIFLKVNTTQ